MREKRMKLLCSFMAIVMVVAIALPVSVRAEGLDYGCCYGHNAKDTQMTLEVLVTDGVFLNYVDIEALNSLCHVIGHSVSSWSTWATGSVIRHIGCGHNRAGTCLFAQTRRGTCTRCGVTVIQQQETYATCLGDLCRFGGETQTGSSWIVHRNCGVQCYRVTPFGRTCTVCGRRVATRDIWEPIICSLTRGFLSDLQFLYGDYNFSYDEHSHSCCWDCGFTYSNN